MDAFASMLISKLCCNPVTLDKQSLIAMHNEAAQGLKMLSGMGWHPQSVADSDSDARRSSSAAISSLRRIGIRDLTPGKRHPGKVLHGRLCVKAFKICAFIQTVLEEDKPETGKAITLKIRHSGSSAAGETEAEAEVELLYPLGLKVAIKEPLFVEFPGGFIGLRIDDPADIVRLESDKLEPNLALLHSDGPGDLEGADSLRKEGNAFFASKDWDKAIELYGRCIDEIRVSARAIQEEYDGRLEVGKPAGEGASTPAPHAKRKSKQARTRKKKRELKTVAVALQIREEFQAAAVVLLTAAYSNRAEAWLRLRHFENAYLDAQRALYFTPTHDKSLLRKGKALHGLQCYKLASSCYQQVLDLPSAKLSAETREHIKSSLLREARVAEIQSRLGIYNLEDFFLGGCKGDPPACADYVGPVEVRHVNQTVGRGLFVTKDVKEGDLLLVSNPVAVARGSSDVGLGHGSAEGAEADVAVLQDLTSQLRDAARRSCRKLEQIYTLADGNKARKGEVPSMAVFTPQEPSTAFLQHDVQSFSGKLDVLLERDVIEVHIDNPRMRRVVDINVFEGSRFTSSPVINLVWVPERETPAGIWILPSFINHSCIPNCSRRHVGDTMFVNASRDLHAGEEVTVAYFHLFIPAHERRSLCDKRGFCCCCPRCTLEQSLASRAPALRRVSQRYVKYSALTDAVGTLSAASKGASMRRDLNQFLESNHLQLNAESKNWIRASYIRPYLQAIVQVLHSRRVTGAKTPITTQSFDMVFDAMISVHPGSEDTLSMLCHPFSYGTADVSPSKSKAWADLALRICRCVYGSFKESTGEAILKHHTESSLRYMEKQVASHLDTFRFEWFCAVK